MQETEKYQSVVLTVAVPTFNRGNCLSALLKSLVAQLTPDHLERIEILVLDNCSSDDTENVVQAVLTECPSLRYVRNATNIGADNNFVKAFNEAQGRYLWILGDDELLFDGAIDWVLKCCQGPEFGAAYIYSVPETLDKVHGFLGHPVPDRVSVTEFGPWSFVRAANYRLTFLSASVINRQAVLLTNPGIHGDIEQFSGSNLVHLTWILSAARACQRSLIVTTPLFASTVANSGGYSPIKVFVTNLSRLVGHYFSEKELGAQLFMQRFTLIGWFPKVVYDCRFSERYRSSGYRFSAEEFPGELRRGLLWAIFEHGILNGPRLVAFIAMLCLKALHKGLQSLFLRWK